MQYRCKLNILLYGTWLNGHPDFFSFQFIHPFIVCFLFYISSKVLIINMIYLYCKFYHFGFKFRIVEMSYFQPRATQRPATPAGHVGLGIGENGSRPFLTAPVFGLLL